MPLTRATTSLSESFTYDANGLLTGYAQTDILSGSPSLGQTRSWSYGYTALASGLKVLTSVDGPGDPATVNDISTFTYNPDGTLATATDPNGLLTQFTAYSTLGQVASMTAPDGIVWAFTYDVEGRITSTKRNPALASPSTWSFVYDAAGQMTQYTNSVGSSWTFTYDGARRLIKTTAPSGIYASYAYDAMGNVTRTGEYTSTGVEKFFETMEFDQLGRILKAGGTEPRRFSYDVEDNQIETRDAFGLARTQLYDALNRVVQAVDEDGSTELFEYNDDDQVTRYTDPRAIDTATVFNGFGEVVSETSADRGTMTFVYSTRGLVTSASDGRGIVTTYEYDAGGRLTAKRYPSNSNLDQVFTYGAYGTASGGKLASVTEGSGTTGFTHNATSGLPATKTQTLSLASYATSMTYDNEDRLTRLSYPSGAAVNYTYSTDGRISAMTFASGKIDPATGQPYPPVAVVSSVAYLPNGPLTTLTFGDGANLTETYNVSYQLVGQSDVIGTTSLRNLVYGWTPRGNLGSVTDKLDAAKNQLFRYSPDQRLQQAGGAWDGIAYTYDSVGNRATEARGTWDGNTGNAGTASPTAANNGDPDWNAVSYLAGFEQSYTSEGPGGFAPTFYDTTPPALEARTAAARIGSSGLAVNAENQFYGNIDYGNNRPEIFFGTGDFTIEGFAKSTYNDGWVWHSVLGNFAGWSNGAWSVFVTNNAANVLRFKVDAQGEISGTSDLGTNWFHFAISRNGDELRLFVNGVMEAKQTGWAGKSVGQNGNRFLVGGNANGTGELWRGYIDELRISKGVGRYNSDTAFAVPTAPYPRGAADPEWSKVTYLASFEGSLTDDSNSALVPAVAPSTSQVVNRSPEAAKIGALGLGVNPQNQSTGYVNYGKQTKVNFGTGDFTIEGFAKANYHDQGWWHALLGNRIGGAAAAGTWTVIVPPNRHLRFDVNGQTGLEGTSDLGTNWFHFAVSRNGDAIRLFVNGVMEAKSTGWTGKVIGNDAYDFIVGGNNVGSTDRWRGYLDELRITKGVGRYYSDASFAVPTAPYPRVIQNVASTSYTQAISQHVPLASTAGVTTETVTMALGAADPRRHVLLNIAWAGSNTAQITSVTVAGAQATRLHRLNGPATSNAELWAIAMPTGTTASVMVTWSAAVSHRHLTLYALPLSSLATASVGSAIPNGSGGYTMAGLTIPPGGIVIGGTLGSTFVANETALFGPEEVFRWNAKDQRSSTGATQLQSHTFSTQNPTATPLGYTTSGPVPYYVVTLDPGSFLNPATATTDGYSYGAADNRLAQIAEAGGHTRAFTHDAAGNVTYDNRSGGGYGYAYDAANRLASFSINGVVQANYKYNAEGQQVVRELTQAGQVIHAVHDMEGNRIAEYLYNTATGASTLLRQYIWMEGRAVAVVEGDQLFFIRTDHIGRPVFATNNLGVKVWEASYLPFGGVHVATGGINLRFPGQWYQAESGLYQNWMRDYDPTTGRYLEADPLGLEAGISLYGYALQNPSRFIDPTGRNPIAIPIAFCEAFPAACAKVGEICIAGAIVATGYIANELWGPPDPQMSTSDGGVCDQCSAMAGPYEGETPDDKPGDFERHRPSGGLKGADGSIWEKDRTGHGGSKWKRWPNEKAWERDRDRESVRPDGTVR